MTGSTAPGVEEERIHRLIRSAGGRLTMPTRLLVTILAETDRHLTADDLIAEVERQAPGITPSTVYRVLQRLDELEIVEHVHSGAGPDFYHLREHGHAHLVCTVCGTIIDVPDAAFADLFRSSRRAYDFTIEPRHSAVLGRCASCAS
jgi:Fur family ferric uptake transcriptional regulator